MNGKKSMVEERSRQMKDYSLRNEKSRLIQASATSLHEHITELFENGYDQGYEDGREETYWKGYKNGKESVQIDETEAYQQGLEDAWEAARELVNMPDKDIEECFDVVTLNTNGFRGILHYTSASEVIAKIKEYEEQKQNTKIKVGDEVYYDGDKYIVTLIADNDSSYTAISADGGHILRACRDDITVTGRHFDQIAEVLAEMRGDDNGK